MSKKAKPTTPTPAAVQAPDPAGHPQGQHIVVADRGFVYVGDITVDDRYCRIKRARNIRRFGTTQGLGQLRTGPTPQTVMDDCGEVIVPVKAVIHYIPCQGF